MKEEKELYYNVNNSLIPFGKYKGMRYADVPRDYLYWLAENIDDLPKSVLLGIQIGLEIKDGQEIGIMTDRLKYLKKRFYTDI